MQQYKGVHWLNQLCIWYNVIFYHFFNSGFNCFYISFHFISKFNQFSSVKEHMLQKYCTMYNKITIVPYKSCYYYVLPHLYCLNSLIWKCMLAIRNVLKMYLLNHLNSFIEFKYIRKVYLLFKYISRMYLVFKYIEVFSAYR